MDKIFGYLHDVTDEMGLKKDRRTFLGRQKAIRETATLEDMWASIVDALHLIEVDYAEIKFNGMSVSQISSNRLIGTKRVKASKDNATFCNMNMCLELPLATRRYHGMLYLEKNLNHMPLHESTLRRIEQLRRSIVDRLKRFEFDGADIQDFSRCYITNKSLATLNGSKQVVHYFDILNNKN